LIQIEVQIIADLLSRGEMVGYRLAQEESDVSAIVRRELRRWSHWSETNDVNVAWRLLIACTHNTTRRIDELIIGGNGMLVKNVECVDGSTIPKKGDAAACGA